MTREYIDERHYKILHNLYDDHGKLIGQKYEVFEENETADAIYITHKWCEMGKKAQPNGAATSNFEKFEKKVYYEAADGTQIQIKKMEIKYEKRQTIYTFTKVNGETFNVEFAW